MRAKVDLSDLSHFVRVAERESFSEAARGLGVPPSTVSRAVARLEDALGVRLLERTTRKVVPTPSGRALLAEATGPLQALDQATDRVAEFHDTPNGHLRVAAPPDLAPVLGQLVAEFVRRHSGITVELSFSNRHVDLVAEGFDLAIRGGRLSDSSLVVRKVHDSLGYVVASPGYLASAPRLSVPADLEKHRAVLFRAQGLQTAWPLDDGTSRVTVRVHGRVNVDDLRAVVVAAEAGEGVALVPNTACLVELESGTLVRVLSPWAMRDTSLSVLVPSNRHLPSRVEVFREFLVERLSRCPGEKDAARKAKLKTRPRTAPTR